VIYSFSCVVKAIFLIPVVQVIAFGENHLQYLLIQ
jgi:hypothetical protein